jgi:carbon storage regulator
VLVIRRRPGETIVIAEDIEIEILEAGPSQVKLGIRAPRHVPVVRKEIQVTSRQNLAASQEISALGMKQVAESLKSAKPAPISVV